MLIFQWGTLAQLILNFMKIDIASEFQKNLDFSPGQQGDVFNTKKHESSRLNRTCSQDEARAVLLKTIGRKLQSECKRLGLGRALLSKGLYLK